MNAGVVLMWVALASVEDQKAELEARLDAERAALEALESDQADLVRVHDALDALASESARATTELKKNQKTMERLTRVAQDAAARAKTEAEAAEVALKPALRMLYTTGRQRQMERVLSAANFESLWRTERALKRLVSQDLDAVEQVSALATVEEATAERARRYASVMTQVSAALEQEERVARLRNESMGGLLSKVKKESAQSRRLLEELERAQQRLDQMVGEMQSSRTSGFRAKKGHLVFPTAGVVEVLFGNVVNPRFNTVTVQKGIDIRAKEGNAVFAVAPGTVVHSGWLKGYGNLLIIDHGSGYHSLMAHLAQADVSVGAEVEEGETVGWVGDTGSVKGSYLYFEIRKNGEAIDPLPWLDNQETPR